MPPPEELDTQDRTKWGELFAWLAKYLNRFAEIFGPVVKSM